ncbi:hypothetical protein [Ancylomarina sp. 16SWW S1-10-2]|uniref:hypothetical protein n=1 Tax=Ancylomarina sp. 16SWW S1-10-2 TaxID=2499681 RepID=UPI0012AE86EA|nr:hypothetical protein [Ancylomarina sp. 16SWW S1-10-2]MRT92926.1 hypothetical protein [Ancylomarina sp. 16SWW S1-10-2]
MIKQFSISIKNILVNSFILLLFFGCIQTNKVSQYRTLKSEKTYQQIASEKFGEKVDCKLNSNKSYALCQKMMTAPELNPNQPIAFFVYDIKKNEIIYEDKMANAKISWHTNTQLKIVMQKGYIVSPEDKGKSIYFFDLQSKKKITPKK